MQYTPLTRNFYSRDTHDVARELLGKVLVRRVNDIIIAGRITEVESYVGENDRACHASKGKTKRTEVMFGEAGRFYVYMIYGMYHCLNVVTESPTFPAAVLIRALAPVSGLDAMREFRGMKSFTNLTSGPGKLCQALDIDRSFNGADATDASNDLFISDDSFAVTSSDIATSERVGVAYAGDDAFLPWRYYIHL